MKTNTCGKCKTRVNKEKRENTKEFELKSYRTGYSVMSRLSENDVDMYHGEIGITKHWPMIFVMAPWRTYRMEEKDINLTMESYVCLSSLPKDLQDAVRRHAHSKK